jgi:hypothetical protein
MDSSPAKYSARPSAYPALAVQVSVVDVLQAEITTVTENAQFLPHRGPEGSPECLRLPTFGSMGNSCLLVTRGEGAEAAARAASQNDSSHVGSERGGCANCCSRIMQFCGQACRRLRS